MMSGHLGVLAAAFLTSTVEWVEAYTIVLAVALSIGLMQEEGLARAALLEADIISHSVQDVLDLLANPDRLKATLRS